MVGQEWCGRSGITGEYCGCLEGMGVSGVSGALRHEENRRCQVLFE